MSFLADFVAYMRSRSDSPPDFFLNGGLVAIAGALGSGVWCDGWSRPIYPNLWVVNIAPSGFGKSVALDMSESLIERAGLSYRKLPNSFSQEGLVRHIAQHSQGVWFLQEFSAFLAGMERSYNEGSQQWLTETFDVPSEQVRILTSERITLYKPCISILGASSPAWFAATYQESALRGGFLARFIFTPSSMSGEYIGHPGPRDDGKEATLAWHLKQCSELSGRFDLSEIVQDFKEWDFAKREALRKDCPPEFAGMRSRAGLLVLKCAMLFHASSDPESLAVTKRDFNNAVAYVEAAHAKAEKFLTEDVALDRKEEQRLKVREVIRRRNGAADYSDALKSVKMDAREFAQAIDTLRDMGLVRIHHQGRKRTILDTTGEFDELRRNGTNSGESK